MPRNARNAPRTYTCLFCNQTFTADQVLFSDEITNSRDIAPDPVQSLFYRDFIRAPKLVPTRLVHKWTVVDKEHQTLEDGSEIPIIIDVKRSKGLLPRMEENDHVSRDGSSKSIAQSMIQEELNVDQSASEQEKRHQSLHSMVLSSIIDRQDEKLMSLDHRICPHCHCTVPKGLGDLPVFRIAMLGGASSGKTTYMLLAANQIVQYEKENEVLGGILDLAEGSMVGESEAFFEDLFQSYRNGSLPSTDKTMGKSIFPLVMRIDPHDDAMQSFFLILQDYPGEGMRDGTFMINNRSVLRSDGAILLVDPEQMRSAKNLEASNKSEVQESYCFERLNRTCEKFRSNIRQFKQLKSIVFTLHKLDRLYQGNEYVEPVVKSGTSPLDEGSIEVHKGCIQSAELARIDRAVCHVFADLLHLDNDADKAYTHMLNMLGCKSARRPFVFCKGISAHTRVSDSNTFRSNIGKDVIGNGHRLLEPVLELLARSALLPSDFEVKAHKRWFQ